MTGKAILGVLAAGLLVVAVHAQPLPMGHPPVGGKRPTSLPAGHPPMGGGMPSMGGMPGMGGMGGMGGMPGMPDVTGSLIVRVVPDAKVAPATLKGGRVIVKLDRKDQPTTQYDGTLDERGWAVFDALPVGVSGRALVTVKHGGLTLNNFSPTLDGEHPDLSLKVSIGETAEPAGGPTDVIGSLIVRAVQGTKGGPAIKNDPVSVQLLRMDKPTTQYDGKLDDHGAVVFDALPVGARAKALVTVKHAGIAFKGVSAILDNDHPDLTVAVAASETTEIAPAWRVKMRHVSVGPGEKGGLLVKDMVVVENPADRAWLGTPGPGGERATVVLNLPADVGKLDLPATADFDGRSAKYDPKSGRVSVVQPLLPGITRYEFDYLLLPANGKVQLVVTSPQPTDQMVVVMTKQLADLCKTEGLTEMNVGPTRRMWTAAEVAAGAKFTFDFTGVAPEKSSMGDDDGGVPAKVVGAWGAGLILVVGLGYLFIKPSGNSSAGRA